MSNETYLASFQFRGFIPNEILKQKSQDFYRLVESRSPSDSKKQAFLVKKGKVYEARLKITSASSCSFEIHSKENTGLDSINSLQRHFFDKISHWNKTRSPQTYLLEK